MNKLNRWLNSTELEIIEELIFEISRTITGWKCDIKKLDVKIDKIRLHIVRLQKIYDLADDCDELDKEYIMQKMVNLHSRACKLMDVNIMLRKRLNYFNSDIIPFQLMRI